MIPPEIAALFAFTRSLDAAFAELHELVGPAELDSLDAEPT